MCLFVLVCKWCAIFAGVPWNFWCTQHTHTHIAVDVCSHMSMMCTCAQNIFLAFMCIRIYLLAHMHTYTRMHTIHENVQACTHTYASAQSDAIWHIHTYISCTCVWRQSKTSFPVDSHSNTQLLACFACSSRLGTVRMYGTDPKSFLAWSYVD